MLVYQRVLGLNGDFMVIWWDLPSIYRSIYFMDGIHLDLDGIWLCLVGNVLFSREIYHHWVTL